MAITVLNTSISSLETDVKKLERQVDEHKRLIVSTSTTTTTPVSLTFVHLSTAGTLTAEETEAADPSVLISPEVLVDWDNDHHQEEELEEQEQERIKNNSTKIADRVDKHGSILIALIAALCVVVAGCLGYVCLRWRCFIFQAKSGKVGPSPLHATELGDVKAIEKPLPGR